SPARERKPTRVRDRTRRGGEWAGYLRLWRWADTQQTRAEIEEKSGGLRRRRLRRGLRDCFAERPEDELDVLPCLRRTEEVRCLKRLGRLFYLLLAEPGLVLQVRLVDRERDRDFADGSEHGLDPRVEVLERVVSSDVAHGVLPDEADFHLHSPWFYHDGPRRDSRKSSGNLRYSLRSI